ncbi:MAG TPA: hypothetical protein V6D17_18500 [Candidatus Obscuribacterales bacterium]
MEIAELTVVLFYWLAVPVFLSGVMAVLFSFVVGSGFKMRRKAEQRVGPTYWGRYSEEDPEEAAELRTIRLPYAEDSRAKGTPERRYSE